MSTQAVQFAIVSAARNCAAWVENNVQSVLGQRYPHWRAVLIDDASTDSTFAKAQASAASDDRYTVLRNETQHGALANIVRATELAAHAANDVIVIIDGDDWLSDNTALERLAHYYSDPSLWLSYGSHKLLRRRWRDRLRGRPNRGQARPVPDSVARLGLYRYHTGPWCASHLRSYRKFLWDEIRDADLRDDDGEYFCSAADVATMLPLMEMAGPEHARYLPDILYVYNNDHASSDNQEPVAAYERQQFICALKIRAKPRYQRLLR